MMTMIMEIYRNDLKVKAQMGVFPVPARKDVLQAWYLQVETKIKHRRVRAGGAKRCQKDVLECPPNAVVQ